MMLELEANEAAEVRQLIEGRLGNLSSEIRHTDSPRVRQELRDEREVLRQVLGKLSALAA